MTDAAAPSDLDLSDAKAALLDQWRRGRDLSGGVHAIPRAPTDGPVPLSLAQERIWFHEQMQPGTAAFNLFFCARVGTRLDPGLLAGALDDLIARHDVLRTTIAVGSGEPHQLVGAGASPSMEITHLEHAGPPALATALDQFDAAIHKPFELQTGPLARVLLCRLPDEDLLGVVVHHLIADGSSLTLALHELSELYEARAGGRMPALSPLLIRYADFCVWQRARERSEEWRADLAYWTALLRDAAPLELATDHPRPAVMSSRGDWCEVGLPRWQSDGLRELARAEGATVFMALLAAFAVLLAKLSGTRDLTIGVNVANRQRAETLQLIGNFANMLALRVRIDGDPSVRELLGRVRGDCLSAFAHQAVPFERVVADLQPPRDLSRPVLAQALFVMQPQLSDADFAGMPMRQVEIASRTSRADLELHMWDRPELVGHLAYNTDLFQRMTIERLARRLQAVVAWMIEDPDRRLSELQVMLNEERALIAGWACGPARSWQDDTLHALVERQVDRSPEAIAITSGGAQLSYASLDEQANRLAGRLREVGAGPDVPVGVCVQRSLNMAVAVLGILKSGSAYVPLDPRHPPARLSALVNDAGAPVIVIDEPLRGRVAASGAALVSLDDDKTRTDLTTRPPRRPLVPLHPESLAYVIYTSGSTGEPKGVQIPHRAGVGFILNVLENPGLVAGESMVCVSSLSFDASVAELFATLAAGATLVVAEMEDVADGTRLGRILTDNGVDVVLATPTVWRLLREPTRSLDHTMRAWCGAEAITQDLADALAAEHDAAWNLYGPTETTVWSNADRLVEGQPVSLGKPVANARVHLLDINLREVPIGAPGEIFIGGQGLARGYLRRPALTAEKFVPDPFGDPPGGRLYATGDLARRRLDGSLEFLGRRDHQVKLRGHRIELGEVEAALSADPAVSRAVVLLNEPGTASARLVAYVVHDRTTAEGRKKPGGAALAQPLRRRLPDHMIPSAWIFLDQLPTTSAGKLDRLRLPAVTTRQHPDLSSRYVAPRTELERDVAALAAEHLGLKRVGVQDDFFELGGHSLLAARLVSALRERHGVELVLQKLFVTPTAAGLAQAIQEELDRGLHLGDDDVRMRRVIDELPDRDVESLLEGLLASEGSDP